MLDDIELDDVAPGKPSLPGKKPGPPPSLKKPEPSETASKTEDVKKEKKKKKKYFDEAELNDAPSAAAPSSVEPSEAATRAEDSKSERKKERKKKFAFLEQENKTGVDDIELDQAPGTAAPSEVEPSEATTREDGKSEKKKKKKRKKEKRVSPSEPPSISETNTFPDADTTAEQTEEEEGYDESFINPFVPENLEQDEASEGEEEEAENEWPDDHPRPSLRKSRKSSFGRKSYAGRYSRFSMRRLTPEDLEGSHVSLTGTGETFEDILSELNPRQQHSHSQQGHGSFVVGFNHGPNVLHHHHHHHRDEIFYLIPRVATVQYGPYMVYGILDFRLERLQGIQKMLQKVGAKVTMVPSTDFVNHVHVWYLDHLIFACKVTDLMHGGDGEMDPLCITAARSFEHVSKRAVHGLRNRCTTTDPDMQNPYCACAKDLPGPGHAPLLPVHGESTRDTFSISVEPFTEKDEKRKGDEEYDGDQTTTQDGKSYAPLRNG